MTDSTSPRDPAKADGRCDTQPSKPRILKRVVVYSADATALPGFEGELPPSVAIDRADTPQEFGELLCLARVGVFRIQELGDADVDRLTAFEARCPLTPILMVLDLEAGNARRSHGLRYGIHTVWRDELPELPAIVQEVLSTSLLQHFIMAFEALRKPSRLITDVLRTICHDSASRTTVKVAARCTRSYPQKLYGHWRRYVSDTVLFKEFSDQVLIARAAEEAGTRDWTGDVVEELASVLGITPQNVYALFKRRHQAAPAEALASPADVLRAFEQWAAPLLRDPKPE